MKKYLSIVALVLVLLAALALVACGPAETPDTDSDGNAATVTITVEVVGSDGKTTAFTIETAEKYLRGALDQENLVQGEEGPYGLYIKSVNGETADYETDGAYWAVYEGDVMSMNGVEKIEIADGGIYKLVYTRG